MPGPRKLERDERFALSNDDLKMNGMPSRVGQLLELAGGVENQPFALDDAGTGDQKERLVRPDGEIDEFTAELQALAATGSLLAGGRRAPP